LAVGFCPNNSAIAAAPSSTPQTRTPMLSSVTALRLP